MKKTQKKAAPSNALALVKRELGKMQKALQQRVEVLPAAPQVIERIVEQQSMALSEVTNLGHLGMQPLELSEKAEAILARDVDEARVLIKPTGAVYYPHIEYTRWFNEAFGRAQWSAVPASKPQMSEIPKRKGDDEEGDEKTRFLVTQDFVLFVHGKPVAQAKAGAEYHPGNRDQLHDDVLEALNASALRRFAKRLGVGDVLWDRRWTNSFLARHGVKVWVRGTSRPQWRHRDDAKLPGETGLVTEREEKPQPPRQQRSPRGEEFITQGSKEQPGQVERLWSIAGRAGRTRQELHDWLQASYGITSLKQIKRKDYEAIVRAVQASAPLPMPVVHNAPDPTTVVSADEIDWNGRQPGEEG